MGWLWCATAALLVLVPVNAVIDLKELGWLGEGPITPQRVVKDVVHYFSQPDPKGIPVMTIPDPAFVPNRLKFDIPIVGTISLWDLEVTGQSEIRLEYINLNLATFTGVARVSCPLLTGTGIYEYSNWWTTTINTTDVMVEDAILTLDLQLGISNAGKLKPDICKFKLQYQKLKIMFHESPVLSTVETIFPSTLQPLLMGKLDSLLGDLLDEKLGAALEDPFPDSILPVDFMVAKARQMLRQLQLDPFVIPQHDINLSWGVTVQLKNIEVRGLTTLYRTDEVTASFIDNAIFATIQLGTQRLQAGADWVVSAALVPGVGGHLDIEVESLAVTVKARQPANIRSPPVLREIDVQLGNIAVRSGGEGSVDYLAEVLVNILPNMLRNAIMDKLEPKIHQVIQKQFNRLDLNDIVMQKLAQMKAAQQA